MHYRIVLEKAAEKYIRRQDRESQERILKVIKSLPPQHGMKKLKNFDSYFRVRVGDLRIIFSKDDKNLIIKIIAIGSRGQVYREIK